MHGCEVHAVAMRHTYVCSVASMRHSYLCRTSLNCNLYYRLLACCLTTSWWSAALLQLRWLILFPCAVSTVLGCLLIKPWLLIKQPAPDMGFLPEGWKKPTSTEWFATGHLKRGWDSIYWDVVYIMLTGSMLMLLPELLL